MGIYKEIYHLKNPGKKLIKSLLVTNINEPQRHTSKIELERYKKRGSEDKGTES